ncbi:CidA/LrgA family protein [Mesobacterium pallidum]|uniref:CidA/LrgA family protein n=1 Tax=Mesobacterium pallidum TaxID=2872037 RepID=UPI001EE2EF62|nr:CidA/LrgA family protein [Mesobacterium pallidum]
MLPGLVLVLASVLAGEGIASVVGLPLPGTVYGLLTALVLLASVRRAEAWITPAAEMLLSNFALFLVPLAALALMVDPALLRLLPRLALVAALTLPLTALATLGAFSSLARLSRRRGAVRE